MMKRIFAYLAVLFLGLASVPVSATTALGDEKRDDIIALIQVTGTMEVLDQLIDAQIPELMDVIRAMDIDAPPIFFEQFEAVAVREFKNSKPELVRAIVAIYDTNFSHREIKELAAFYKSSTGRKIIAMTPQIVRQSLAIGQVWGAEISQKVIDHLEAEMEQTRFEY